MYLKVGVYELDTSEEFKNEKEAVSRFLDIFPDANPEKVKAKVKPYFRKDVRISAKLSKESDNSKESDTSTDSASVAEKQPRKDK